MKFFHLSFYSLSYSHNWIYRLTRWISFFNVGNFQNYFLHEKCDFPFAIVARTWNKITHGQWLCPIVLLLTWTISVSLADNDFGHYCTRWMIRFWKNIKKTKSAFLRERIALVFWHSHVIKIYKRFQTRTCLIHFRWFYRVTIIVLLQSMSIFLCLLVKFQFWSLCIIMYQVLHHKSF